MIDLHKEQAISLEQAARLLPPSRSGRPVSRSCVFRWIIRGIKTPRGLVRLEGHRIGRRFVTTTEALARFAEVLTPNPDDRLTPPRSTAKRETAADRAGRELERIGL